MGWVSVSATEAADRNSDFVAALRERGWDDTAVDYLEWVEKSPLITAKFREELAYQRGLSRAAQGREARSLAEREQLLAQAAAEFAAFAKEHAGSDIALDSLRQAANLNAELALQTLQAAKRLPEQATAQREEARGKAREWFKQATLAARQLAAECDKELAALPKPTAIQADEEAKARRDKLRNREVEARFLVALLMFEQAATYEPESQEHSKALEESSSLFGALVEEHRGSLVEATSRFYQGRCAQELGAFEKALGCYQDLTRMPGPDGEFRRWTARAHRRRTECLMALDKLDDAIVAAEEWLAASRPAEREQAEWLEIQFRLAEAYQKKAKQPDASDVKDLQTKARNLLRDVSQHANEFQHDARLAMAALGQRGGEVVELKSFADAFAAGKMSLELWNSSTLAARLARENNPEAEEELTQEAGQHRQEALRALELAVELADRQTPLEQLNTVRYYLSVLYWEDKRTHEAAVLSEFITRRYPESEFAASAAKVALAAYEQLAIEARAGGQASPGSSVASYESRKLKELSELVASRWPESSEASSAVNVLIQTALRENRLAEAEALLERLPAGSRGAAELSLGAGLWMQYLRATAGQRGESDRAATELRDKAGSLLKSGFESLRKTGNPTASSAAGSLYLVQYLLARGDADGALDVLEAKSVGPLTLVKAKASAVDRPEFVQEAYKAALRAYLSASPPQREQADAMMTALEQSVGQNTSEKSAEQLTQVYLSLGVQLQRQMKELTAAGHDDKAQQVAAAFGDLLERVAKRPDADSWRIGAWLAHTNLQIGQALSGDEATAYINRAQEAYRGMLAAAEKDASYAPNATALIGVRMRLGECLAALGHYDQAVEQYAAVLRDKPNMLDLQQAAAVALQEWGAAKKDAAALDRSIRGDLRQPNGKNLIWGWLRLAGMANSAKRQASAPNDAAAQERAARFEDLFFEARYNVAKSRYLAGMIAPPESRREQLEGARSNIEQMSKLYPGLGGAKWKTAYDELLTQINLELAK